jgi:hypothetical protein
MLFINFNYYYLLYFIYFLLALGRTYNKVTYIHCRIDTWRTFDNRELQWPHLRHEIAMYSGKVWGSPSWQPCPHPW